MDTETIMETPGTTESIPLTSPSGAASERGTGEQEDSEAVRTDPRTVLLLRAEAEGLTAIYPDFDPDAALAEPMFGALLRGESAPSLRQIYEATHMEAIVESHVRARLDTAVAEALAVAIPEAVTAAVAESEERLLSHIRARGQRPGENGVSASVGIRMHPAVDQLTRRERAMLAERAGRGESIRL